MEGLSEIMGAMTTETKDASISIFSLEVKSPEVNSEVPNTDQAQQAAITTAPVEGAAQPQGGIATNTTEDSIDAKAFVAFADVVLARVFCVGARWADLECKPSDFELTASERAKLEPLTGKLMKKYLVNLPDEWMLGILIISIYGAKALSLPPSGTKKEKKKIPVQQGENTGEEKRGRGRPPGSTNKS